MESIVRKICQKEGLSVGTIQMLSGGQVNQVYQIDAAYVVRMGPTEKSFQRLAQEKDLLQRIAGLVPVPGILAFGELDGFVYQVQAFIAGQKLHTLWRDLSPNAQEGIVAELAAHMQMLHKLRFSDYGYLHLPDQRCASWPEFLTGQFKQSCAEIETLKIPIDPALLDLASAYFEQHEHVLAAGVPTLVHGDLWPGNILVENGRITAILDFEFAAYAPADFELLKLEDFCLYPNDYAEEDHEIYCTADFAGFFPLLRKHYPALFETPFLRERMNLYLLESALGDFLAWRKAIVGTIPLTSPAAMNFILARISNAVFSHGARMFM